MQTVDTFIRSNVFLIIFYACGTWLCAFTVRERIRVPRYLLVLFVLLESLITYGLRLLHWSGNIPFVFITYWLYCKMADVEPFKLLYILLVVVTYLVVSNIVFYMFEGSSYTWDWSDLDTVLLGFATSMAPMSWFLRKRIWPRLQRVSVQNARWLWIVPAAFIVINLLIGSSHIQFLLGDNTSWVYNLSTILITVTTVVICFLVLTILEKMQDSVEYENNMRLVDMQIATQARRFSEMTKYMNDIRVMRHDMRHHMRMIQLLLAEGKHDEIRAYLKEYDDETSQQDALSYSANYVGDLIARHSQLRGQAAGIDVDIRCALPERTWISDTDLCVVLGNLMENAINACVLQREGTKFIRANARAEGSEAIITIENSCNAFEDNDSEQRRLAGIHESTGFGIPSIRAVAAKYNGTATFERKGNRHYAVVLLYEPMEKGEGPA